MRHFLFHSTDATNDKKMSRAAGWAPAGAARGMATTFYCGNFVGGKSEKLFTKSRLPSFQAAWRVENRHAALVKELVLKMRTLAAGASAAHAAFGIFSRLEVTHINFLFLLFAH